MFVESFVSSQEMFYSTRQMCKASNKRGKRESGMVKVLPWDLEVMPSGSDVALMLGYNEMSGEQRFTQTVQMSGEAHVTVFGKQEAAGQEF